MISNYKPPGSFQSILIPTLRSKNTFDTQNTNLLASTVVHYLYHTLVHCRLGEDVDVVDVADIWGETVFFLNSFIKVVVVFLLQTIGRNDCEGSDYPELSFFYCFFGTVFTIVVNCRCCCCYCYVVDNWWKHWAEEEIISGSLFAVESSRKRLITRRRLLPRSNLL